MAALGDVDAPEDAPTQGDDDRADGEAHPPAGGGAGAIARNPTEHVPAVCPSMVLAVDSGL